MPRKEQYGKRLTNQDVLKLLQQGKYYVDFDTGVIYSKFKQAPCSVYGHGRGEQYLFIRMYDQPKSRTIPVSHVVWMAGTNSVLPDGWEIHHWDLDTQNNAFDNLFAFHPIDHRKFHQLTDKKEEEVPF